MKVKILGCSGGIGGRHMRTTAMLVDHDILIDAGTGVGDLTRAELAAIRVMASTRKTFFSGWMADPYSNWRPE